MKLTTAIAAALLALPLVTADACGGTLVSLCCETVSGPYPRGYVGSGCSLSGENGCGTGSEMPLYSICCQQLDQNGLGYYCATPHQN
ncbi:hypothetical protein GALMADRAFT_245799 [Galerina marginata CBS 339.88]|uniref:Hydrophobin n=1 Tax=Galerina marginata (strain CBS 339.88) TaxID=685588 RepID=A0A067T5N8_GALM3|nr:hypothetical protein GALMADRAFT_245799 [Galerina marginata CBS 339.88]